MSLIRELFKKFPALLIGNIALLVIESALAILALFSIAPAIDLFLAPNLQQASPITRHLASWMQAAGLPVTLASCLLVAFGLFALKNGLTIFIRYRLLQTKYAVLRELMLGSFEDFFNARWLFFSGQSQGTLLNTFLREMMMVGDAFGALAWLSAAAFQLAGTLVVPCVVSWRVTAWSLGAAVLFALPGWWLSRLSYRLGQQNVTTANRIGVVIQESLGAAKVILGFGNPETQRRHLGQAFDAHRRVTVPSQLMNVATPLLYEPFGLLVIVIALGVARHYAVPLADTAVLLWALRSCVPLLGAITMQRNALANFVPSYEQVQRLRAQAQSWRQPTGTRPFTGLQRGMTLERLTFTYPGREAALVDVTLRIPRGRVVAIVGESGSGKSTLLDLLLGLHEPAAGQILVDDRPFGELDLLTFRRRVGYVPQDTVLFNLSVRDNLRWAHAEATNGEIEEACRRAHADEFITRLPQGYDTLVGDRGVRLSGGQCQRLALARALVRRPDLLILDEATSALDTRSERLIQEALEALGGQTTVVVVAHRLSTIVNADHIYVLDRGRLAEDGTYAELMGRDGLFKLMVQRQALEAASPEEPALSRAP